MEESETFFFKNHLSQFLINRIVYECTLLELFMDLCERIDEIGFQNIKGTRRNNDLILRDFVLDNSRIEFSERELKRMIELVRAHVGPETSRRFSCVDPYLRRQGNTCAACGSIVHGNKVFHDDHIVPYCYVYENLLDNGQALCPNCNSKKLADPYFAIKLFIERKGRIDEKIRVFF